MTGRSCVVTPSLKPSAYARPACVFGSSTTRYLTGSSQSGLAQAYGHSAAPRHSPVHQPSGNPSKHVDAARQANDHRHVRSRVAD